MIAALKTVFGGSARYAWACPLLFAVPLLAEFAQHVVEVHLGLYESVAQAKALEGHPLRMGFGYIKVIALVLTGYWAVRFLGFGNSARAARRIDPVALRLYGWVVAWGLFWLAVNMAPGWFVTDQTALMSITLALMVFGTAFEICLSGWKAAAAMGNPRIGFLRSITMIRGSFWWAVGVFLLTIMPLMIAHYAAFALALGAGPVRMWTVMVLDSVLTAYLGVVIAANVYVVGRRMAERHGETLAPA
ncbi:hypothetical protein ABS767_10280 [Sphingomonas sp. ST-64]|uniref:Intracellular septation protein A n=1 Tax=Sphingomonas plantiphila TaxID=3163295 RepID=A0ABW8YNY0_9SPHN